MRRTWNPAKDIRAGDCPDLHEINCFDFFEGMRIVAAIEVQADGTNRLHCCCTVEEDTQLMDAVLKDCIPLWRMVEIGSFRLNRLAGVSPVPTFLTDTGGAHFFYPPIPKDVREMMYAGCVDL